MFLDPTIDTSASGSGAVALSTDSTDCRHPHNNVDVVALRSHRLETLFGVPLDGLVASHLETLVSSGTQESFDLDYKRDLYGGGDSDRRKLAGDVAALANTAGGVIVLGIDEDDQARATDAPGVMVSDAEIRRIRQVVAALVAPVPMFDVLPVPKDHRDHLDMNPTSTADAPSSAVGFIVIAVPRSPRAPHAVLVNDALRFPKRNGSTTRYLSEPELAAEYRARFAGSDSQVRRVEEIEHDGLARLDTSDLPWVVVSLVPDLPGDFTISQKAYRDFLEEILHKPVGPFNSSSYWRAWTGRRRLLADGTSDRSPLAHWAALELHTDGSGVYSVQVEDLTKRRESLHVRPTQTPDTPPTPPPVQLVDDESIVLGVLSGLLALAQHARDRAATGGGALVRAQLHPVSEQRPTQIGHARGLAGSGGSRGLHSTIEPPPPAETSALVDDIAFIGPDLVAVTCRLVDELGQAYGIPEMGQLTPDGQIRRKYWNNATQASLVSWAEANGIQVSGETLES